MFKNIAPEHHFHTDQEDDEPARHRKRGNVYPEKPQEPFADKQKTEHDTPCHKRSLAGLHMPDFFPEIYDNRHAADNIDDRKQDEGN